MELDPEIKHRTRHQHNIDRGCHELRHHFQVFLETGETYISLS